ncbi:MAG TPA: TadE/TadG family type IV pilus assembly protein [Rickettsiales bacterium]|nr:TadE/TadG family type IV pilus assembly protein [Rickettsiales bacterium]
MKNVFNAFTCWCGRKLKDAAGSTAIEFAIAFPIFQLFIMGIIEYSLIIAASSVLEGAVLAGAREGSTGYVPAGQTQSSYITSLIKARVNHLLINSANLQINIPANANTPGALVVYTATYNWPVIDPVMKRIVANNSQGTYTINATAVIQNEMHP